MASAMTPPARVMTEPRPAVSTRLHVDSDALRSLEEAARAQPAETAAKLGALLHTLPTDAPQRPLALALRGMVQARRHDTEGVDASLQALDALKATQPLAATAAALVRATQAKVNGPRRRADRLAQDALAMLPADAPEVLRWSLVSLLADVKEDGGDFEASLRLRHESLALADRMGDLWRRCDARGALAYTLLLGGQAERGRAVNDESLAMARAAFNPLAISRALNVQFFFLGESGDTAGELAALEGAIFHARQAGSREDAVLGLANLADHYLKRGDFDTALKMSREALPLARELGDRRSESVALGNIGLALISKRQLDQGLHHIRESIAMEERIGALTAMAAFELETGGYLERAGYLREAVAAYQRHRKLADAVSRRDQQQATLELQEAHDHERRQREIELLQRDHDLKQAALLNQTMTRRLWVAGALAALLLVAVAGLLLHRLRRHNSALKEGNALLRTLSEHDMLTGLANRHQLNRLRLAAPGGVAAPFEGGLLLIDIDHFKRINDRHGHAAGDTVLVEAARRLRAVLRAPDLIVRWGGEEFLVVTPALPPDQLAQLAQRLLDAVGKQPVALGAASVAVTVSIGYAGFPTVPTGLAVPWERALALVDTALYLAKAHGRNLAYGIGDLHARDDAELATISHGLEAAWRAGQVQLAALRGPAAPLPQGEPAHAHGLHLVVAATLLALGSLLPAESPAQVSAEVSAQGPAQVPAVVATPSPDTTARFDAMLLLAEQAPARARAALDLAGPADTLRPNRHRDRDEALLRAWVAVRTDLAAPDAAGDPGTAPLWAAMWTELATASAAVSPRLADADRHLMQALLADRDGLPGAETLARQALAGYEEHCGTRLPLRADCEVRGRWQARLVLAQQADRRHAPSEAHTQAQAMLELALTGRDRRRQAWSESQLALAAADLDDSARAAAHQGRAELLAGRDADLTLQQRLAITEAALAWARGNPAQALQALQRQWELANRGQSPRQRALALANLSDHAVKTGAARQGLQTAEQGLVQLGAVGHVALRSVLLNNAMLARAALGRVAEARIDFEALQAAWAAAGAYGRQLSSLREFSDALATAGDLAGALEMHHREQALADQLTTSNREAALAELRIRFDREAQQRRILLLERNNALTAAALANQALNQRLWAAAGGVLALAALLLLLLVRRVRETRRRLQDHQDNLRVQSERDALTGVTSRRHAQTLLRAAGQAEGGFSGALLMIDIDHFKQVNDGQGHAVGDQVLAEAARRIAATVRPQDLVARWGGEEFLVHAPGLTPANCEALAQRLLQAVAGTPVVVAGGAALRVTVSLGHGVFPLVPHRLPLSPEQALNLADMALYTAKSQGRHRATGIRGCTATDAEALQAVEADFERAWQDGRVSLHTEAGPGSALDGAAGARGDTVAPAAARPAEAAPSPAAPHEAGAH